jgi:hypothetical protein
VVLIYDCDEVCVEHSLAFSSLSRALQV